jgi:hypothetical protein
MRDIVSTTESTLTTFPSTGNRGGSLGFRVTKMKKRCPNYLVAAAARWQSERSGARRPGD